MEKNGKKFVRKLNPNRSYISKDGEKLICMVELYF